MTALTEQDAAGLLEDVASFTARYPKSVRRFVRELAMTDRFMKHHQYREGWRYQTLNDLLFDLGKPRRARLTLPEHVEPMEVGQCYANAHALALEDPDLTYVEGVALYTSLSVQHAWVVNRKGRIIDPTWAGLPRFVGHPDHAFYLGVPFDTTFIVRNSLRTERHSIFGNNDLGDFIRLGLVINDDGLAVDLGEL